MYKMSYQELKQHILSSLDISSGNLKVISEAFSKLYIEFQTEAVRHVNIEVIPNTCFKWVRSEKSDKNKVLLFFHGGGYTMGNTEDHLELIAQFILKTQVSVLSVDYRLLPNVFPAPLEDVTAAYNWLLKNGFTSQQIGFAGISAGGLLVTQLILKCQQEKLPQPKMALVMSGPANLRFDAPSFQYNVNRDWITLERLRNIQNYYLPKNTNAYSSLLSPMSAEYTDYPATLFQAGDFELLIDDSLAFYQHLRQNNLNVYLDVVSGLPHCWQFFAKVYEPGKIAIENACRFIEQFL